MLNIATHNFNVQHLLIYLKTSFYKNRNFVPIKKYGKCYIQATTPQKTPLPISEMEE